jgi:hypothetical protein
MSEIIKKLDVLEGGLRINDSKRNFPGCIRFNKTKNLFEVYTGQKDCENNDWSNIMPRIATNNNLGYIKVGNNLVINSETGKLDSISSSKSQIYQHIINISPYKFSNNNFGLPENISETDLSKSDFYSINEAIQFIRNLDLYQFKRDLHNQWIIKLSPGIYLEENISIPAFVSIEGSGNENTFIQFKKLSISSNTSIKDLCIKIESDINENQIIYIDTSTIDKELDYYNKSNTIDLGCNNLVKFCNLVICDEVFENKNLIHIENGNLVIMDTNIDLICFNIEERNIINLAIGNKLEIINGNIKIQNSVSNTNIINCQYSDIVIKNSEINLGIDLDMEDNESNLELQEFNIINNLYSNLAIYNSILENSYINGCVINTNEEEIFFTELISNLVYRNNIAKFSLDTPILNDIKGIKINNHRFSISNIYIKSNDYIMKMKINVNENKKYININKNDILKEGNYEDIILEILYEIKTFNSLLRGDIEKNLEEHYFFTKL